MPLSDEDSHLSSDDRKQRTKQQHVWCEDCCKYISDKTKLFNKQKMLNKFEQ